MTSPETSDVALKLLHTADWHLGRRFAGFDETDLIRLSRARIDVLDKVLLAAEHEGVDAILCAGDLFDEPNPNREWWAPLAAKLAAMRTRRPVFLLPGNHDPLQLGSVYHPDHPFRRALPSWAHVVDRDDYSYELKDVAVLHACPCRSRAGQDDPALALPPRTPGDERIRIGMVHGSTFDAVDCQTNFPIAKDAALQRGFDYLAIGDAHSFRSVPPGARPPMVYSGAPEATTFGEPGAGHVVAIFVSRSRRVTFRESRVAFWTWEERTIHSLAELRTLKSEQQLSHYVLRLILDLHLTAPEFEEAEVILRELKGTNASHGRVGILQLVRQRMVLDTRGIDASFSDLPDVLRATAVQLRELERGDQPEVAREALYHLFKLVRGARAS